MVRSFSTSTYLTFVLATLLSVAVVHFVEHLDLNKRVYNHAPGECSLIHVAQSGASDMVFFDNTIFFASGADINNSTNNTEAGIYALRVESKEIYKPQLLSFNEKKQVNPHGLSIFMNMLFVTNTFYPSRSHDRVDIFAISKKKDRPDFLRLKFVQSVVSDAMSGIRGIAAISKDQFYVANRHFFRNSGLRKAEIIFKLKTGSILFFNGKKVLMAVDNIPTPTGLAFDRKKRQLYVSCFSTNSIHVYNTNLGNLTKVNEIQLTSAPYFISYDELTQTLFATAHPLKIRYIFYESYHYDYFSPSQVLEIKRKKLKTGKSKWSISQLYVNDGATISAATGALMTFPKGKPKQLLIGNMHSGILACDVIYV